MVCRRWSPVCVSAPGGRADVRKHACSDSEASTASSVHGASSAAATRATMIGRRRTRSGSCGSELSSEVSSGGRGVAAGSERSARANDATSSTSVVSGSRGAVITIRSDGRMMVLMAVWDIPVEMKVGGVGAGGLGAWGTGEGLGRGPASRCALGLEPRTSNPRARTPGSNSCARVGGFMGRGGCLGQPRALRM